MSCTRPLEMGAGMAIIFEKQHVNKSHSRVQRTPGQDCVEAYDMLQRHWPYSKRNKPPSFIEAAWRLVRRRQHSPLPPRLAFKSTVDYYVALCAAYDDPGDVAALAAPSAFLRRDSSRGTRKSEFCSQC